MPKKRKGRLLVSSGFVCKAKKNNYNISIPGPIGSIWPLIFCRPRRTILASFCGLRKSHFYGRVPLHEAPIENHNKKPKKTLHNDI